MADYDDIRKFFDGAEDLQNIARRAANVPIVSGFVLDVDNTWIFEFDRLNNLTSPGRYQVDGRFFSDRAVGYRRRDLNANVPAWENHAENYKKNFGKRLLPVVFTIVHRPLRGDVNAGDEQAWLQQLVGIVREANVAVWIEERPRARLAFASGDEISVGPGKTGTLGGVLRDQQNGALYGMTCAHVAKQNDVLCDSGGNQIGTCIADTTWFPLNPAQVCDPVTLKQPNPLPGNGPDMNMLDCGLVKLNVPVSQPVIAGVAQSLSGGQSVKLKGASTHSTSHRLGSLCLSYGFVDGGQNFCFRDLIELIPDPNFLGFATVPTQGDSGGWVLTDDNPPDWAGVFFGEDGKRGFLIRAKWAHDWAEKITGANLVP